MATIQNIKILHKRYTSAEWTSGILLNGETLVPTLAQGEIGLATDTLEVRIGTNSAREQTFAEARPIDADVVTVSEGTGGVVTNVELKRNDATGKHELHVTYGKISVEQITDLADFKVNAIDNTAALEDGEVKVITNAVENASIESQLDVTYGKAATKKYVNDVRDALDGQIKAKSISVEVDGQGSVLTGVKTVTNTDGGHTVILQSGDIEIPSAAGSVEATGAVGKTIEFVKSVKIEDDADGNYKLSGTTDSITLPTGTGSIQGANSTDVLVSATLNDHELSGATKTIVSATGSKVSVTGTDTQIQVGVDLSDYATRDELNTKISGAMHYEGVVTPGIKTAPTDLNGLSATNGALYIANSDGYVIDTINGIHDVTHTNNIKTAVQVLKGDSIVYHEKGAEIHWDIIPAADDIEYRPIQVAGTELVGLQDSSAVNFKAGNTGVVLTTNHSDTAEEIIISHKTNSVADLSVKNRQYVTGLDFDEFGHVVGYSVGTETVVDTNDNTAHTHSAGDLITVTGAGGIDGNVEYGHATITTNTEKDASKKATVTAGSGATFTVVDSLTDDGHGHITKVTTKDVQIDVPADTNTLYDISAESTATGAQVSLNPSDNLDEASNVQLTGEDGTTVSFKDGKIVITSHDTTYELATEALAGLLKVANVLSEAASANATTLKNYTGNNADKLYGVNRRADGTAFVEVPWQNTQYTASNGVTLVGTDMQHSVTGEANLPVDMYAFGTDSFGHVTGSVAITTLDGNYA